MQHRPPPLAMLLLALSAAFPPIGAQGITSAALEGIVLAGDGTPVPRATVRATAPASGAHWQVVTDAAGRYFVEHVQVGGPYVVEAKALGFRPARQADVMLALGQRYRADFVLGRIAVELPAVTVSADRLLHAGRTGPAHIVTAAELADLPNLSRDLSVVAALGPLAISRPLGGISIGGQNQGFNSLQVDGGVNADVYLGRTPGGASPSGSLPEVLPHAISLETVQEFQVLAAPFDVRLGSFAGGLLNAVTKSGTNELHASLFGFLQSGSLMGRNAVGERSAFTSGQFGGSLAGPIVRDRIHLFLNADLQRRVVPDPGPFVADGPRGTRVSLANAVRFQNILSSIYGMDPGSLGPTDGSLPAQELFAKLTVQLGDGHLELSQRYAHADRRDFMDVGLRADSTALSSVASWSRSTAHTSRLIWNTLVGGRAQSEAIVSYQRLWDSCQPNGSLPRITVGADGGVLVAGPNSVCPTTAVDQSALEITENLTLGVGGHLVTLGSHGELFRFRDPLVQVSAGRWFFLDLDSLQKGSAYHYDRGLPSSPRPAGADFHAFTIGVYAQDRWTPTSRLTLTAGLRVDVPYLPDPVPTEPALASGLGIDTGVLPSGNASWSPRLGVNYDVTGEAMTFFRGGVGLFSGPPPYRWLGNAYRESGDEHVVNCDDARVPAFTPHAQPQACLGGAAPAPRISYFEPGLRFPQNLKVALGMDRRFSPGTVAMIDLLYTRAIHQIYVDDANLGAPVSFASGEGNRPMYGRMDQAGRAPPAWLDASFGEIYRVSNRDGDRGLSVSAQVTKRIGERLALYASYAWSGVRDRMSLVNFPARANFSNTPLDGPLDDRRLRPSFFETPHKLALTAMLGLPHGVRLSLLYQGASQPPYTYVVNGDANGDRVGAPGGLYNDVVYVPVDFTPGVDVELVVPEGTRYVPAPASEYARLESFVAEQPCLRAQRGRLMERGSCRNGWLDVLNARLTKSVALTGARRLEITADVFNLPNLIHSRWGRHVDTTTDPSVPLLQLRGWNLARQRGRYELLRSTRGLLDEAASRWRAQLGARYVM